jgi:nucleoside-diphosphate-sugar epimerase
MMHPPLHIETSNHHGDDDDDDDDEDTEDDGGLTLPSETSSTWHDTSVNNEEEGDDEKLSDNSSGGASQPHGDNSGGGIGALRSSPTSLFAQTMGLHQRPRHNSRVDDEDTDGGGGREYMHSRMALESPENKYGKYNTSRSLHHSSHRKRRCCFCGKTVQTVLLVLALSYLGLVFYIYRRIASDNRYYMGDREQLLEVLQQVEKLRMARAFLDEKEGLFRTSARDTQLRRDTRRRERSQPATLSNINLNTEYTLTRLETDEARRKLAQMDAANAEYKDDHQLATMETLCGFHAQNASLSFPHHYSMRDSLGPQSRVLITGVTNMLGIRLALVLHNTCRANVVAAMEPTFPNTIANRLQLMEPMQLLDQHVPKLTIQWSHIGLNPSKIESTHRRLNITGELDLVSTFQPTHIVHLADFFRTTEYNSEQHPYVKLQGDAYVPSLYQFRSSLIAMEQILLALATTRDDQNDRPHFVYVSSPPYSSRRSELNVNLIVKAQTHRMQEIMADVYHSLFKVQSTALRLPSTVFGPWDHDPSTMHRLMEAIVENNTNITSWMAQQEQTVYNLLYVNDAVDGLVAAMQFRSAVPIPMELAPQGRASWQQIQSVLSSSLTSSTLNSEILKPDQVSRSAEAAKQYLGWFGRTSVGEGLVRTLAWYLDRKYPFIPVDAEANQTVSIASGDRLIERHSLESCPVDDSVCHSGPTHLPCASECSSAQHCSPSMFDNVIHVTQEVTEACEIVLYTQSLAVDAKDLNLHTEYMEEGSPLICTVAFVAFESPIVQTVVQKVPDNEQVQLGVVPRPEDNGAQEAIHELKRRKLNGRLLYQGWILVWPDDVPEEVPHASKYLLKLSPGRFFAPSVTHAVYIEEGYGVSPKHDDIKFLVNQLKRHALPGRTVKKKTPPKTKIRFPAEPARRAVILLSELRRQESKRYHVKSHEKISIRQATRFMRFETGEHILGKEQNAIKVQREFYERMVAFVNRNTMRSPTEPQYSFAITHWARTRWVVHDLQLDEGRELRCAWYQEHAQWEGSPLDQLSFAYIMAKEELRRRLESEAEPADRALKAVGDWTELKRLLTDVFEWHALFTKRNDDYTPYGELTALPYDHVDSEEGAVEDSELPANNGEPYLFARIISDRSMTLAREHWFKKE